MKIISMSTRHKKGCKNNDLCFSLHPKWKMKSTFMLRDNKAQLAES